MTASKSYDMLCGNKRRTEKHTNEKEELHGRIAELEQQMETGGEPADESNEAMEIRNKLLKILGERN